MDEVGGALIAIALVLCAVFIPAALISGIQGQFFRQFAVTIAAATVISAFISLTLSPALCAILLKPHAERVAQKPSPLLPPDQRVLCGFNTAVRAPVAWLRRADAAHSAARGSGPRRLCRPDRADRMAVLARPDRVHPGAGPGLSHHRDPAAAGRLAGADGRRGARGREDHHRDGGRRARRAVRRLRWRHVHQRLERRRDLLRVQAVRGTRRKGADSRQDPGGAQQEAVCRSRTPSSSPSSRRRCAASAPAAASR